MKVLEADIRHIAESDMIAWAWFDHKTVLITGGTGLIGRLLALALLDRRERFGVDVRVVLPVRNTDKAEALFPHAEGLAIVASDILAVEDLDVRADFVIHCAAPTQSSFFVSYPAETIHTIVNGTRAVLEYARKKHCEGVVCLSSMEVFGQNPKALLGEEDLGELSLTSARSSYPMAKRLAELLCFSYSQEYGVPVKTARLAQTFGPGVSPEDSRVFMQFCQAVRDGSDIVLMTTGESVSNYCYTTDAALGILRILQEGKSGEAYTIVSDDEYITIRDIAQWLLATYGNAAQTVRFDLSGRGKYAVTNRSQLSNAKTKSIGWTPEFGIREGYDRLLRYLGVI